jgi:hypothetical protein
MVNESETATSGSLTSSAIAVVSPLNVTAGASTVIQSGTAVSSPAAC